MTTIAADQAYEAMLEHHKRPCEELAERVGAPSAADQAEDLQATVVSLLLRAAALARAGDADRACKIAASAWAALRGARPDLAARVAAALHGLARRAGESPGRTAGGGAPDGGAEEPDLDVRQVSHAQRHGLIFTACRALAPGAGFVLVNGHDPRPLRYQFEAQYAGEYTWDYLEAGPDVWRVRIGRASA